MKKNLLILFMLAGTLAMAQSKMELDKKTADFGKIKEGEKAVMIFTVTNKGNLPLIIIDITRPCGCTMPEFPKEPIAPGKKAEIKINYDSDGHPGTVSKMLQIHCNDPANEYVDIYVNGEVIPKPKPVEKIKEEQTDPRD